VKFPKPTYDSPPDSVNDLHAQAWDLPGGHKLWWRKHPWKPAYWALAVVCSDSSSGVRIDAEIPLGAEAPGVLLYTAALLQARRAR
jgi:hypothetical protein